ncbi:putative transposable element [Trichonephila clavipes]|nr:putative transposable element [Trichonephila clavipes]
MLETLQDVFFWDGVQKPCHVSLSVRNIVQSLNRGNRKKSGGLRSGEYGGCSICTPSLFVKNGLTILAVDEAHFWLNGYVNKQNFRIWSEGNPQVYVETPLHAEKLTVRCALWAGGIIGPYFFKNDEGHKITELWFQQDDATCHTARATIDLLKDTFGDHLISRFGPVNWPPRSCDLTPLDYFLWGYVKSLVYADKPQTLDHLTDNIRRVIADIRPQMLEKVIENWTSRLDYIRASRGSHMPEIIFKIDPSFRVTIDPAENHETAAHIIVDPPPCLTVERRQSR